jgi:hypothetical protein
MTRLALLGAAAALLIALPSLTIAATAPLAPDPPRYELVVTGHLNSGPLRYAYPLDGLDAALWVAATRGRERVERLEGDGVLRYTLRRR